MENLGLPLVFQSDLWKNKRSSDLLPELWASEVVIIHYKDSADAVVCFCFSTHA